MKGMLVVLVILIIFFSVFIGSAVTLSERLEEYSLQKMEEPKIEKIYFYNIKYTYLTAKYDRALKLIETYNERYGSEREYTSEITFIKARTYDRMGDYGTAMNLYKEYKARWPEGKKIQAVKDRITHKILL